MKLATSLVAFATLFASLAQAQLNAPPSLRRSTLVVAAEVDVCVDIKAAVVANALGSILSILDLGIALDVTADICICASILLDVVATDSTAQKAVSQCQKEHGDSEAAATAKVVAIYQQMFNKASSRATCPALPIGATRFCNAAQGQSPCGVTCPRNTAYNAASNQCISSPSARALSPQRRAFLRQRDLCTGDGFELCPVGGLLPVGKTPQNGWECVNTFRGLETCGGCPASDELLASINLGIDTAPIKLGVDCSTIAGVSSVACATGKCSVDACLDGWARSTDNVSCTKA